MDTELTRWIQQRIDTLDVAHKEALAVMKSGTPLTPEVVSRVVSKGAKQKALKEALHYIKTHPHCVK